MSNYTIDFTDPLSASFSIPPGGYNGPGGTTATTTLRLYGQGAREWGESVDENLVKLLENFMGASAPLFPRNGQLWIEAKMHYFDTDAEQFYSYDYEDQTWIEIGVTSQSSQPTGSIGQYWLDTDTNVLWLYFAAYKQAAGQWHQRAYMSGSGLPISVTPALLSKVYDAGVDAWVPTPVVNITTSTAAPANDAVGTFRFNPVAKQLYVWDGTEWDALATTGNPVFTGELDANSFKVVNLANATDATDAVNLQTGDARYLKQLGGTLTGAITLSGAPTNNLHAATKLYVDTLVEDAVAEIPAFPVGGIIMWSPLAGLIPDGWYVCDGNNNTPDLRDKFIMASGSTYEPGDTGGSADSLVISHTHSLSLYTELDGVHTHNGTTDAVADHTHGYTNNPSSVTTYATGGPGASTGGAASADVTDAAGAHSHTFTTAANVTHRHQIAGSTAAAGVSATNANLPPYVVMAFIMRGAS